MKTKETSYQIESSFNENLSDLMKELSDEEAGACVGGTVPVVTETTEMLGVRVSIEAGIVGLDTNSSLRVKRRE